ncbi:hypothetical protein NDU88_002953 [Pleurodeles waltl]|uniref:Uncharacterized protein n=1 Tax=Pleurodeles waltl TaxID=8319 RepID=A0AAV7SFN0_PLEWA|nr:hypothetical protein NDU88_002953 [Pleurodeles waltl]
MTPQIGAACAAPRKPKTACPVALATTRPASSPRTWISGFPGTQKGRTDYTRPLRGRTRRSQEEYRAADRRRRKTTEGPGTTGFPKKQPIQAEREEPETRSQTTTPQEGRGLPRQCSFLDRCHYVYESGCLTCHRGLRYQRL